MCCAVPMGSGLGERGPYTATGLAGSVASRPAVRSAGGGEPRGTVLAPLAWLDADQPPIPGESRAREPDDCADAQAAAWGASGGHGASDAWRSCTRAGVPRYAGPVGAAIALGVVGERGGGQPSPGSAERRTQPCSRLMAGTPPGAARRGGGAGASASALDVSGLGALGALRQAGPGRARACWGLGASRGHGMSWSILARRGAE